MSKKIKDSPLWIAAKKNHKLSPQLYKEMLDVWKGLSKSEVYMFRGETKMTTAILKRAFHSNSTTPEIRVMVLQKIFEPTYKFLPRFKAADIAAYKDTKELGLYVSQYKGEPYITLKTYNQYTYKYTKLPLTKKATKELISSLPLNVKSQRMLDSVKEGNIKGMKASSVLQQLGEYFLAMVDMIYVTNKINNIWNFLYVTSEGEFTSDDVKDTWKEETIRGMRTDIFINDLTHMKNEYQKIIPILSKLGVETNELVSTIDEVLLLAKTFHEIEQDSFEMLDLFEAHKNYFQRMNYLSSLIERTFSQINTLSSDTIVKRVGSNATIPTFVHYNPNKAAFIRVESRSNSRAVFETHEQTIKFPIKSVWAKEILKTND